MMPGVPLPYGQHSDMERLLASWIEEIFHDEFSLVEWLSVLSDFPVLAVAVCHRDIAELRQFMADRQNRAPYAGELLFALVYACKKGYSELVEELLPAGADPTVAHAQTGRNVLMEACVRGHLETVKVLLQHERARRVVNATDSLGQTALVLSCDHHDQEDVVRALLHAKADPGIADDGGWTAEDVADVRNHRGSARVLRVGTGQKGHLMYRCH